VNNILRSLPAKWRPKVTTIGEARDLNTLSLENLISSLKFHEIGLNEQEPVRKSKSKTLKIQKLKRWICSPKGFNI